MKKKKWFKKRYIPVVFLILVVGCNAIGFGDMTTSEDEIFKQFKEAGIKYYSTRTLGGKNNEIFFAQASNATLTDSTPVFIFAHGTPGTLSNSMAYLLDTTLLRKGIVVAYDRPGFGLSYRGKDVARLETQVVDLKRLMEEFEGRKIFLIGHSYGAPIILHAAMDYPNKVAGIVWLGGVVHTAWKAHAWWRKPINHPPLKWFIPSSMIVSNKEIIHLGDGLRQIENRWNEVTCPVIMIQGSDDWLAIPSNTEYADSMLVATSYKKTVVVPDASHFFYFSKTRYIVSALETLLEL